MPGPLAGIRVIETATGVAGPYCGRMLAGLGAQVVKVEPPAGDSARREGPFPADIPHRERSGLFLHLNTGKKSVVLPENGSLGDLLRGGDVLITGTTAEVPDGTDRLIGWWDGRAARRAGRPFR